MPWLIWRSNLWKFLSTPSARRATNVLDFCSYAERFLSTPSARRATRYVHNGCGSLENFYPRPPRGGRPTTRTVGGMHNDFYPRPPRGGRPLGFSIRASISDISIHALREEGDYLFRRDKQGFQHFYPRPPRGGRLSKSPPQASFCYFYPRPPRGGRPAEKIFNYAYDDISIHALREEGDARLRSLWSLLLVFLSTPSARRATDKMEEQERHRRNFYPRPPRGGRLACADGKQLEELFLSTPSARRATRPAGHPAGRTGISIHALREEGDKTVRRCCWIRNRHFYPRPPRGGRPAVVVTASAGGDISIHALREEGD